MNRAEKKKIAAVLLQAADTLEKTSGATLARYKSRNGITYEGEYAHVFAARDAVREAQDQLDALDQLIKDGTGRGTGGPDAQRMITKLLKKLDAVGDDVQGLKHKFE